MNAKKQKNETEFVGIVGLGKSGIACYNRAKQSGIEVITYDDNKICPKLINKNEFKHPKKWDWKKLKTLIISPGIPHNYPKPHYSILLANSNNVEIISEVEFAIRTGTKGKWVVITGTNGKSTTTALLGHILQSTKISHAVGGNIGLPVCSLPILKNNGVYVIELSSYQLENTPSLKSIISVILNITPDHIERHLNFERYFQAKSLAFYSTIKNGTAILGNNKLFDQLEKSDNRNLNIRRISVSKIFPEQKQNPSLQGMHNAENCAAVKMIADILQIDKQKVFKGISTFPGLPHRMQLAGKIGKIIFINDSKATNGISAAKALSSFTNIFWCAGGISKEDGIKICIPKLNSVIHAFFFGDCKENFIEESKGKINYTKCNTLEEAVLNAFTMAEIFQNKVKFKNLTILLSPAASSFDQFKNYEERGKKFLKLSSKLTGQKIPTKKSFLENGYKIHA